MEGVLRERGPRSGLCCGKMNLAKCGEATEEGRSEATGMWALLWSLSCGLGVKWGDGWKMAVLTEVGTTGRGTGSCGGDEPIELETSQVSMA